MISEGALAVALGVASGRVRTVRLTSTRPRNAPRALVGRALAEARVLVPLLFPVCGMAQAVAFERAVADAAGHAGEDARDAIVLAEAAASHLFQLAIAWRDAAGAERDVSAVREVRANAARLAKVARHDPPAAAALAEAIAARVEPFTTGEAPLLELVEREGRADFGEARGPGELVFDARHIGARLAADPAFAAHPTQDGAPRDASAFGVEARGGLLARLRARRLQARRHVDALRRARVVLESRADHPSSGEGIGAAETARGPLVHWLRVEDGKVADLRVVAPTDWTFHPEGTLRDVLLGAPASPTLARDAGWLVLALDPCAPFSIEVHDA